MQQEEIDHQQGDQQKQSPQKQPQGKKNDNVEPQKIVPSEEQAQPNSPLGMQPERVQQNVQINSPESNLSDVLDWLDNNIGDLQRLNPDQSAADNKMREDPPAIQEQNSLSSQIKKLAKGKVPSKWNRQFDKKKGRFSPEEEKILNEGIRQFLAQYEITHDDFIEMLYGGFTKSLLSQYGFFKIISNLLPNRSTYSCYSYIRRNFMDDIKKGPWTVQESAKLLKLVDKYGNKWAKIGKELGRHPTDVSLKYQTLGCNNASKRVKGSWKLGELVKLLKLVDEKLELNFFDPAIQGLLAEEEAHNMKDHLDRQNRAYNSKQHQHHNDRLVLQHLKAKIRRIPLELIPWADIGKKMKTRSMIDCKNKFLQLVEMALKGYKVKYEGIIQFVWGQVALQECQIDWQKWQGHDMHYQQAKNRFLFAKKLIKNKSRTPFIDQLAQLKNKLKSNGMY